MFGERASPKTSKGTEICGFYNKEVPQSEERAGPQKDQLLYVCRKSQQRVPRPHKGPGSGLSLKQQTGKNIYRVVV